LIRERHRLLYEPNEKRFYRYEVDTGLWTPQTAESLEQVACELVNTETKSNEDVIKHAQLSFGRAVVGHLAGMNEQRGIFDQAPCGIHVANGYLVIKTGLPSFIVTLATFFVLKGINLAVTKLLTGTVRVDGVDTGEGFDTARSWFATKIEFGGASFQVSVLWWIGFTIFATWLLTRTTFGNWIFASGGDANAARNAGVPVARTKITLFILTSVAAALVGCMTLLELRGMQAGQGLGQEFYYIIAAAVGGTLLTGGAGSAIGASIGAIIMGFAAIGIPYALWDQDWVSTFLGVILFLAVLVNTWLSKQAKGARK
jgi:simple sugar transport system permease protein